MIQRIRQVSIKNYKSIENDTVALEPFTVLVGRNGTGKSNFVDALAFTQESLSESVEFALHRRGGLAAVRRCSHGRPTNISIQLTLELEADLHAEYSFEIIAKAKESFQIARERCSIERFMGAHHVFEVHNGTFIKPIEGIRAQVASDRLALYAASATEEFRPLYDFLTSMRFYSIAPDRLRELQKPDPGVSLNRDGSNSAAVLKRLKETMRGRQQYERLCRLLSKIVEGVRSVDHQAVGRNETLQFEQDVGLERPWIFEALSMSDGTLRLVGLLLAIFQRGEHRLIAIEEPEATVHPAVMEAVVEILIDASKEKQILLTTHSPDILDQKEIRDSEIRVVTLDKGRTIVAPVAESNREVIRDRLYTAGDLLRVDELAPDLEAHQNTIAGKKVYEPKLVDDNIT